MSADACATCGHPQTSHRADERGCDVTMMPKVKCPCTAYLPPRPVPEEAIIAAQDEAIRDNWDTPATVPAPHAEAETAWHEWQATAHQRPLDEFGERDYPMDAFIAGYLRGRGDRG